MFFILIYSPALMAFALCFHVLLPKEIRAFQNPWKSSLKILAMMIGEFEYEGTFMTTDTGTDSTSNSTSIILAQVISVFFLCISANLLTSSSHYHNLYPSLSLIIIYSVGLPDIFMFSEL